MHLMESIKKLLQIPAYSCICVVGIARERKTNSNHHIFSALKFSSWWILIESVFFYKIYLPRKKVLFSVSLLSRTSGHAKANHSQDKTRVSITENTYHSWKWISTHCVLLIWYASKYEICSSMQAFRGRLRYLIWRLINKIKLVSLWSLL